MKSLDYFEAGLPIINNIHGDTWKLIDEYGVGINYNNGILKINDIERGNVRNFYERYFSIDVFAKKVKIIIGK